MSRKHNIDRLFCKIAQKHEEKYDPRDWEKMQHLLREEGLCRDIKGVGHYLQILSKVFYGAMLLLLVLTPSTYHTDDSISSNSYPTTLKSRIPEVKASSSLKNQNLPVNPSDQNLNTQLDTDNSIDISKASHAQNSFAQNQPPLNYFNNLSTESEPDKDIEQLPTSLELHHGEKTLQEFLREMLFNMRHQLRLSDSSFTLLQDSALIAQSTDENTENPQTLHLGLAFPLSTQWKTSIQNRNAVSLHALVGSSGSLKGFEASGIGNIESGTVTGVQLAGIFNHTNDSLHGLQVGGIVNVSGSQGNAAQIAGIVNVAKKNPAGETQNRVDPNRKKFTMQLAGISNIDEYHTKNLQASGIVNLSSKIKGLQLSGLVNVAEHVDGVQIGGLVNVAHRVKGVQLGLINVVDSLEGVSIGLINVVKRNAYRKLEFWGTESFHTNLGLKLGTRKFYNIFVLGSQISAGTFRWGLGYGFGTQMNLTPQNYLNLDLIAYHVNEERRFTTILNLLTQFKVSLSREFGNGFGIYGGPTLNLLVSDFKNSDNSIGSQIAPWTFFENYTRGKGTKIKVWGGFNFGVRF